MSTTTVTQSAATAERTGVPTTAHQLRGHRHPDAATRRFGGIRRQCRKLLACSALLGVAATGAASASPAGAQVAPAPCVIVSNGIQLGMGNWAPESCAKYIRSTVVGSAIAIGSWGRYLMAVDGNGGVYVRLAEGWAYWFATPYVMSLTDRCILHGDAASCQTFGRQVDAAIAQPGTAAEGLNGPIANGVTTPNGLNGEAVHSQFLTKIERVTPHRPDPLRVTKQRTRHRLAGGRGFTPRDRRR